MGTQTDSEEARQTWGGRGPLGVTQGLQAGRGAGSALGRSIGGGGIGRPLPGSGVMAKSPQRGRVRAKEGQRLHHCRLGGCGLGGGAAAPPPPPPSHTQPQRSPAVLPSQAAAESEPPPSPLPALRLAQLGNDRRGAFPGLVGWRRFRIVFLSGFPPACDPRSLQELRDPFGEVVSSSPMEGIRI